ncbi:MAG: hemerythrin domain-containing protein [Myxococcota bacterium]|nr:hemerythrin domain-containing protein [Myxococcota bacterium]
MSTDQPGLKMRLGLEMRRMAAQHRRLRTLYAALCDVLGGRDDDVPLADAFSRYEEALHAHFSMEERMAFPAMHGLRPDLGPDLEALVREHGRVCDDLVALGRSIEEGGNDLMPKLEAIAAFLDRHEAREEGLVAKVEIPEA